MIYNTIQNYKPFLLCYLPIVIFFAIIQNFIDRSFVIVILMLLIMSITLFCVVMEKYNNYHSMAIFASFTYLLYQCYTVASSICDCIFLFFPLCVVIATNKNLQANSNQKNNVY